MTITAKGVRDIALASTGTERHKSELFPAITYYRFFRELTKLLKPELSVELGTAAGGASMHMADGWPAGKVITIDRSPRKEYEPCLAYVKANYPNWDLWRMDTVEAADKLHKLFGVGKINLLYVDATHERKQVFKELRAYKDLLADGCVIVFDDLYLTLDMEEMWSDLREVDKIRIDVMHPEVGMGAMVYKLGDFDNLPED